MKPILIVRASMAILLFIWPSCSTAAPAKQAAQDLSSVMKKAGLEATRGVDFDICFPATAEEYEALGKNALLRIAASSVLSTELPLRSVYVMFKGVRVPLQRVALLEPSSKEGVTVQISFYLLPTQFLKSDAAVLADFRGERKGFSILRFAAKDPHSDAPAFVRLDEYDVSGDADPAALAAVLSREYPDDFPEN